MQKSWEFETFQSMHRKMVSQINSENKILQKYVLYTISRLYITLRSGLAKFLLNNTKS